MNEVIAILICGVIFYVIFFASYVNKTIDSFNELKESFNSRNIRCFKDVAHSKLYNKIKNRDGKLFENNVYVHAYYCFICCLFCIPILFLSTENPSVVLIVLFLAYLFIMELILKGIIKHRRKRFENLLYITETYSQSGLENNSINGKVYFI